MKMNQIAVLLLVFTILFEATSQAGNGMDRGGGGPLAAEVQNMARDAIGDMRRWSQMGILPESIRSIDWGRLEQTVNTAVIIQTNSNAPLRLRIDRCTYHPQMAELSQCHDNQLRQPQMTDLIVAAINDPSRQTITLSSGSWSQMPENQRMNLALHEIICLARLQDRSYEISYHYWRLKRQEHDLLEFRTHARQLLQSLGESLTRALNPSFAPGVTMITTLRASTDFINCTQHPELSSEVLNPGPEADRCLTIAGPQGRTLLEGTDLNRYRCSCFSSIQTLGDAVSANLGRGNAADRLSQQDIDQQLAQINLYNSSRNEPAHTEYLISRAHRLIASFHAHFNEALNIANVPSTATRDERISGFTNYIASTCSRSASIPSMARVIACSTELFTNVLEQTLPQRFESAREQLQSEINHELAEIEFYSDQN